MRTTFESFTAVLFFADVISILAVTLAHVTVEMRMFLEGFCASLACLGMGGELFSKLSEGGLLKL